MSCPENPLPVVVKCERQNYKYKITFANTEDDKREFTINHPLKIGMQGLLRRDGDENRYIFGDIILELVQTSEARLCHERLNIELKKNALLSAQLEERDETINILRATATTFQDIAKERNDLQDRVSHYESYDVLAAWNKP